MELTKEPKVVYSDVPLNWKARIEEKDGKKELVIEPISETIKHPDGSQDVILKMPSLDLIKKFKKQHQL